MHANVRRSARRSWYSPIAIARSIWLRPRTWVAALVGAVALMLLPEALPLPVRAILAWNAGGLVYVALALHSMSACAADVMASRAARQADSRMLILVVILLARGGIED